MITFKFILETARKLKGLWRGAHSFIDLVDLTDFYLLLFEDNLYEETEPSRNTGWYNWEVVRMLWLVAFIMTLCGVCLDEALLWLFALAKKPHWARFGTLTKGL